MSPFQELADQAWAERQRQWQENEYRKLEQLDRVRTKEHLLNSRDVKMMQNDISSDLEKKLRNDVNKHLRSLSPAERQKLHNEVLKLHNEVLKRVAPKKLPRWRRYAVTAASLSWLFEQADFNKVIFKLLGDVPQGARIVRWGFDQAFDGIMLTLEHSSFAEIDEGAMIPSGGSIEFEVIDGQPQAQGHARR